MNSTNNQAPRAGSGRPSQETLDLTRRQVRDLLLRSEAFRALPPAEQQAIAKHTVDIATYLAEPDGIRANRLPNAQPARPSNDDPYALSLAGEQSSPPRPTPRRRGAGEEGVFTAQAAREGAEVAGLLLTQVNFPTFVSGLIEGVFTSIVDSSIRQMEAYAELVKSVAMTLNQFRDENVSANQGRDHLVDQFPDLFEISMDSGPFGDEGSGPRVRLRAGVDESAALKRVKDLPVEGEPLSGLDDESIEEKLVPAARTQLATSRQQLLATMVLMGINRIVVTDGKISAKVTYDFKAQDNFKFQKSATSFDYAKDSSGNLQTTRSGEGESEREGDRGGHTFSRDKDGAINAEQRGGTYYAKGAYKYADRPVMTVATVTQQANDAALTTKASLAGMVEVNFKSDYLPLEKMADSFQIGMIQNASKPGQAARGAGAAQPAPSAGQAPPATPAPKA